MPNLMKGETWAKGNTLVRGKPRFQYPVGVEVKLDEIRCHVIREAGMIRYESYAGKPLHNLEFLNSRMARLMFRNDLYELDCGILVNKNFNDSYRWVRSSSKVPSGLDQSMVQVLLFDVPDCKRPYATRRLMCDEVAFDAILHCGLPMIRPEYRECANEAEVLAFFADAVVYAEGLMVKTLDHLYERKRTFGWLKLKPEETHDGVITEILEAHSVTESIDEAGQVVPVGTPLGRAGSVRVRLEDGSFADPSGIRHDLGRDMFMNPDQYLGRWVEFKCMERDRQGGYRHPVFKRLREDKA